jgi:superkiller protein 3
MLSNRFPFPVLLAALAGPFALACGSGEGSPDRTGVASSATPATSVAVATTPADPTVVTSDGAPSSVVRVSYADAETAFRRGRYQEATDLFAAYAGGHPDNAWGHYMYGLSAWKSGEHERAMEGFDQALRLDPDHRKSLLNSARVLLETSRPREALTRIERALSLEPLSSDGLRLLGRARYELAEVADAIDAYQRALAIDDRDVWSMNNLGLIYIQQGRSHEALPPLARAVELRDKAPVFQNNLGTALEGAGQVVAARRAYAAALEADSTYGKAAASLARLGGPVDPADTTATFDLATRAREFQAQVQSWRENAGVPARDTAAAGE